MPPQYLAPGEALGPRRANEILAQYFEHRRARDARQDRGLHHRERNRRKQQRTDAGNDALTPSREATGREPLQLHREQQDEQDGEPEIWNRDAKLCHGHHTDVTDLVVIGGGIDSGGKRQHHRQKHRHDGQRNGQDEPLRD